jgi:predicted nucleotidyltransferase
VEQFTERGHHADADHDTAHAATQLTASLSDMRELVERSVARVRREEPDAVAMFLCGSRVRGEAGLFSDFDFDVLVPKGPRDRAMEWFDGPVRVSAWVRDIDLWLAERDVPQEWAFHLPCEDLLRLCWSASDEWRERLDRKALPHRAGTPELDHLIGDAAKVANARRAGDELGLRLAAQDLARSCPALLHPVNKVSPVHSRRAALRAATEMAVAPPTYQEDLLACLGLTAGPTTAAQVYTAAGRIALGVLDILAAHDATYAPLLPADLLADLRAGVLRSFVERAFG